MTEAPKARRTLSVRPGPWTGFVLRRAGGLVAIAATLVVVTFAMIQLIPGDPAETLAGQNATPADVARIRHELGLDRSAATQFAAYVAGLPRGDLGRSFQTHEPVADILAARLPFTAELAAAALLLVLAIALPLGIAVAARHSRRADGVFTLGTGLLGAVPEYVIGTVLVVVFAITLRMLPAGGAATPQSLILPMVAIALPSSAVMARVVRREAGTVLAQDYIRTARGRRLPGARLYLRHVLPNLLPAVMTLSGLVLASLLGGTVVVETVFAWPGIGQRVVDALLVRDYPVIQGCVLVLGLLAATLHLAVDVLISLLDPRSALMGAENR